MNEAHTEPGERLLCPASYQGRRCNRYFWTVPAGIVVHARALDLRDSGELEQAADQVLFLHPVEAEDVPETGVRRVDAILAKNRDGMKGTVQLTVSGSGRWREVPRLPQPREVAA